MQNLIVALLAIVFSTNLFAQDVLIFSAENKNGAITPKTIENVFVKNGFYISENRDMNIPFKSQFKETSYDVYNLFTPYHKDTVKKLIKDYPDIGLFSPMSLAIWTKKGETEIHVSTLSADTLSKITGIPAKKLQELESVVRKSIKEALKNSKETAVDYKVKELNKPLVTKFSAPIDADDWEEEKEEFMMMFEGELGVNGFVLAGFNDLQFFLDGQNVDAGYDFYDVESICKLPVIYTVSKVRPEAGSFAPCSMYFYKKEGEDSMKIAFPNVYNWISSLNIEDKESLDELEDAQQRIVSILESVIE